VSVHHGYLRLTLPLLDRLAERIARGHTVPPVAMDRLERELTGLADLFETHIARQESWLFPRIRHLREPIGEVAWLTFGGDRLEEQLTRMIEDNQEALNRLDRIGMVLGESCWLGKGPLVEQLNGDMDELHENFADHARIEGELLVPHVHEILKGEGLAV
jgi:iron-sulfur cluster repair protein YtfE (RIC family)